MRGAPNLHAGSDSSGSLAQLENLLVVLGLASGYLLVIGLAEMTMIWVNPKLGFAVYSLVLLAFSFVQRLSTMLRWGVCAWL